MAEQNGQTSSVKSNLFVAGLQKDYDDSFTSPGMWSHARNASKVTASGSLQTLSNESSNKLCVILPYTHIGSIHLYEDKWAVFSTDNTNSEIGLFDDSDCSYVPVVTDPCNNSTPCLNFSTSYLIKGIAKQNHDCSYQVYFVDGLNPDRTVNINKPQFLQDCTIVNGCHICVDTCQIDCNAILLASLVDSPCITLTKSRVGGSILNGSYFVVIAYTINDQRVTDYFPPSNVQSLFTHANAGGSLDIKFSGLDTEHFTEFELVIVRTVNQQTSAKRIGIYSTQTKEIFIDSINESLTTIPIEFIPIRTPVFEKSEAIYSTGDYAIRVAPTTKFDFNYQPLANRIRAKWISVEYPSDCYRKGGNVTSNMRDEVYPYFIRWIYNTGDRSSSYHVPGRYPDTTPYDSLGNTDLSLATNANDNIEGFIGPENWMINNTARILNFVVTTLPDGGRQIAEGDMGYWESTEIYPDNRPDIWNLSYWQTPNTLNNWPDATSTLMDANGHLRYDLCGQPIRHHKMPDNLTDIGTPATAGVTAHINTGATQIRVIGVKFENIRPPLDNDGNPIPGIVGYEILRGSREGNKTVIAKGILNNMRGYIINDNNSNQRPGLYQNYPYNYQGPDPSLVVNESTGGFNPLSPQPTPLTVVTRDTFTFHSPDTQFRHPFLSTNEMKIYGDSIASIIGNFETMPHHPKEKLMGNLGFVIAALVGVGEAMLAMRGVRNHTVRMPYVQNIGYYVDVPAVNSLSGGGTTAAWVQGSGSTNPIGGGDQDDYRGNAPSTDTNAPNGINAKASTESVHTAVFKAGGTDATGWDTTNLINILAGLGASNDPKDVDTQTAFQAAALEPGVNYTFEEYNREDPKVNRIPGGLLSMRTIGFIPVVSHYWALGTDTALRLIEAIIPYEQYACRYISHGNYNNTIGVYTTPGLRRYLTTDLQYLEPHRQSFGLFEVNNLYRSEAVIMSINPGKPVPPFNPVLTDNSLTIISQSPFPNRPGFTFPTQSVSKYVALIQRIRNQYGQLDSIQQVNIGCKFGVDPSQPFFDYFTTEIFGGDTYITRYTEKNTFFYFYDWLMDQPDGFEFDYRTRYMLTYPRYWADFTRYEPSDFIDGIIGNIFSLPPNIGSMWPTSKAALDAPLGGGNTFGAFIASMIQFRVKPGYFYIAQSGVRDFFVESEVNTDLRDWGDVPEERHFDPYRYAALEPLFDPRILKVGNYFKYDYSLSISRLYTNFISWGNLQPRYYDPFIAETCYTYRSNRLIYSLPQNLENTKDYWKVWLANNYKDFYSKVSVIKPIAKNGAIILFNGDSPLLFQAVDSLQTDLGTKITIGDGRLFSQPQQSIVNVDISHEYGSCQDRLSVINTPFGLFYMCANQGKIFKVTNNLTDITYFGLKFWFKEYLPYKLLEDFPNFDILDNPVAGIGCQAIYDNQIETIYFCKRDLQLIPGLKGTFSYTGNGIFSHTLPNDSVNTFTLGDPNYFRDASWTVSYDPKTEKGGWISFHDWHPGLNIPSRNNFLTSVNDSIWRHNADRSSFCKYYNQEFPFELEYIISTQTTVNTVRSIEYYLECYKYAPGRLDRYQLLDFNFDHAVFHNSEQVSGMLDLKLTPKNDAFGILGYPRLTLQPSFEVLYSKEEQKYRVQTIFDITDNRGEFSNAQRMIWITGPDGYIRTLNPLNLNYNKSSMERKKFRHYTNKCLLIKKKSGEVNMSIKTSLTKELVSLR